MCRTITLRTKSAPRRKPQWRAHRTGEPDYRTEGSKQETGGGVEDSLRIYEHSTNRRIREQRTGGLYIGVQLRLVGRPAAPRLELQHDNPAVVLVNEGVDRAAKDHSRSVARLT